MALKKISFLNKQIEYEICVLCKTRTNVRCDKPVEERQAYVEGVGQLCYKCYKDMYFKE